MWWSITILLKVQQEHPVQQDLKALEVLPVSHPVVPWTSALGPQDSKDLQDLTVHLGSPELQDFQGHEGLQDLPGHKEREDILESQGLPGPLDSVDSKGQQEPR